MICYLTPIHFWIVNFSNIICLSSSEEDFLKKGDKTTLEENCSVSTNLIFEDDKSTKGLFEGKGSVLVVFCGVSRIEKGKFSKGNNLVENISLDKDSVRIISPISKSNKFLRIFKNRDFFFRRVGSCMYFSFIRDKKTNQKYPICKIKIKTKMESSI